MKKCFFLLLIAGAAFAVLCSSLLPLGAADKPPTPKKVGDFTLKDIHCHDVSLSDFKDKKAVVVVFVGTECPINNQYMARLAELHKTYTAQGVQFLAVNSNCQDNAERVAEHAQQYRLPFPVLKDEGTRVADQFGAQRTPEAVVLDAEGR